MKFTIFQLAALVGVAHAFDLEFDQIQCDTSLPAYTTNNGISMECDGDKRCSFGEESYISGNMYYDGLDQVLLANSTDNGLTNTGYVSAKLQLMTLQYDLFQFLPFNFCGDWTEANDDENSACPGDGTYYFSVPYELPEDNDFRTWFATGWQGMAYLKIYQTRSEESPLLAHCRLHFRTYVTESNNGTYTLPSAAETTLFLFAIIGGMLSIIMCITCRKKTPPPAQEKQVIRNLQEEDSTVDFSAYEDFDAEESTIMDRIDENLEERVGKLSVKMDYIRQL